MDGRSPQDVDGYLAGLPEKERLALELLRERIRAMAPEGTTESISYGIPTYKYRGRPLIYFGAAKKHLAVYGVEDGTVRFQPETPPSDEQLLRWIGKRRAEIEGKG